MASPSKLQEEWNTLYRTTLPGLAKAHDPAQPVWPIHLDHCFARIILDNAIGVTRPWTSVLKSPAYKHMSETQLLNSIALGKRIENGTVDLAGLDQRSLELRGKTKGAGKVSGKGTGKGVKRKAEEAGGVKEELDGPRDEQMRVTTSPQTKRANTNETISKYFQPSAKAVLKEERFPSAASADVREDPMAPTTAKDGPDPETREKSSDPLELIKESDLTPFRKQVLILLCHVPRGSYTTYAALSDHIRATSHKTCARAVGNAMRNNPFAPAVPCHRVLAADGRIGGFGGHWGEEGKFAGKKKELLRAEGVKFDGGGKVVGSPYRAFKV